MAIETKRVAQMVKYHILFFICVFVNNLVKNHRSKMADPISPFSTKFPIYRCHLMIRMTLNNKSVPLQRIYLKLVIFECLTHFRKMVVFETKRVAQMVKDSILFCICVLHNNLVKNHRTKMADPISSFPQYVLSTGAII